MADEVKLVALVLVWACGSGLHSHTAAAAPPEDAPRPAAVAADDAAPRGDLAAEPTMLAARHERMIADGAEPADVLRDARQQRQQQPDSLSAAAWLLFSLDEPSLRKKHLDEVVATADEVLARVRSTTMPADQRTAWMADALYRKGRALGYMELPDVLEVRPIANPQQHNAQFETTFKQLDALVDTTEPQFILLRIRRERRRGNFDEALRLLEIYRARSSDPHWYEKKRRAILEEAAVRE